MRACLKIFEFALAAIPLTANLAAQVPTESTLPAAADPAAEPLPEDYSCMFCHGKEGTLAEDEEAKHLIATEEDFAADVHWQNGVRCHDCHGGNPVLDDYTDHRDDTSFRTIESPEEAEALCAGCHEDQRAKVSLGEAHNSAGERDDRGRGTPLKCGACHGVLHDGKRTGKVHGMRGVRDEESPVFLDHQIQTCGGCHAKHFKTYKNSVHGLGLSASGLLVTAACSDCHNAHDVYYKNDDRNPLHRTRVAGTCGQCHRFLEERLQKSVHGRNGLGGKSKRAAPDGKTKEAPSCIDCHQGHDLPDPKSTAFRLEMPHHCGNCHVDQSKRYAMSMHGQLTALGYGPAAKCSDCHGAHDILPACDPNANLSATNRKHTCQKCHPRATGHFLDFDPHADHHDPERNPALYWVYVSLLALIFSVFGFFGMHSAFWFVRSLIDFLAHGRPKGLMPGTTAYVRFKPFHRVSHAFLLISFLGLALTGLPLKYSSYAWAQGLAYYLGGFESTGALHRVFGVVNIGCLVAYVFRLAWGMVNGNRPKVPIRRLIFGPDSPVPNFRDFKDFGKMSRWFVGLGPKPKFERWTYWEKFDLWGAVADIVIIGTTGLILWFPNLFCSFMPGMGLNIAKVVHSTQALLATGFVFAVHFFNTHLRVEKFPIDVSILTGLVTEEELRDERPEFLERMRREGRLEEFRTDVPSRGALWLIKIGGFLALAVGLILLAGMILAGLGG